MQRRNFIQKSLLLIAALGSQSSLPAWAQSGAKNNLAGLTGLSGREYDLTISEIFSEVAGQAAKQIVINGQLPAPLLRWHEGDDITLRVHNHLNVNSSIHWHGILLPFQMDGVPGVSFPGIAPGETYEYHFPIKQAGTYWYHSHSGFQEQQGHYGPIIIDPREDDPVAYDREYVVVLSDWSFEDPQRIFSKLKKMSTSYNFQRRTMADFLNDARRDGLAKTVADRTMWGAMRMNPTDLSDVTAATYTYLINGHSSTENWTGLFQPGERVRLRFINASAMTIFNVRIPDLPMTVVQADGLNVQPIEIDEFQIGTAETFDVIVSPDESKAYSLYCETNDRSGFVHGTLATREGMVATVPALRPRPLLGMKNMASDHTQLMGDEGGMPMVNADMAKPTVSTNTRSPTVMDHSNMEGMEGEVKKGEGMEMPDNMPMYPHNHAMGPGVMNVAMSPVNRLSEPPLGLENEPHRVLVYTDLLSLAPNPDQRSPERELEIHLTSNMERYMWSFDGLKFSEVETPIAFVYGERLRLTLVNDTMMPHPIHLHGMFFELVTGEHHNKPQKHTVVVKPGEILAVDITADAIGEWAFHCHLLYHMHAGMMQTVLVTDRGESK